MPDVAMPRLSDSMEEGTILKWLKSDGDDVATGEELVEIETDKANMTYESDAAGTLVIVAQEGDTLPVGDTIARIGEAPQADGRDDDHGSAEAEGAAITAIESADDDRVLASPVAKRMARELGIELAGVNGTGPGGRIVKADVEAAGGEPRPQAPGEPAAGEAPPTPAPVTKTGGGTAKGEVVRQELTRLQQVVARRMAESKATAPEFVLNAEIEMDAALSLRKQLKELARSTERPSPSVNDMVVKACALALRDFPRANGAYRDGQFELYSRVNVGIAVAAREALVVPTVYDADSKGLGEIARDSRALAERVRTGAVTPPELSGGTFTVSNLGMFDIKGFTAVINPPQAAILAVGAITERPVVRDGEITTRRIMNATLTCDHRILYGSDAAGFLARICELLERPVAMSL